jgi:hypothetical protein
MGFRFAYSKLLDYNTTSDEIDNRIKNLVQVHNFTRKEIVDYLYNWLAEINILFGNVNKIEN